MQNPGSDAGVFSFVASDSRSGRKIYGINRQWRVCSRWTPDGPEALKMVDYH
jgi:plasmid maintenance system killer protein